MKPMRTILKYLKKLFLGTSDQRIIASMNMRNIRNMFMFSLIACILDAVSLIVFSITDRDQPRFWQTLISVSSCILACGIVIILSRAFLRRYQKEGSVSNIKASVLTSFFYAAMSAWGIAVDTAHYAAGEQMLTFYIVQCCFLCFVVMRPKTGGILIALSFSSLYVSLYLVDGAVGMQSQNYIIFMVIAVLGNGIQHMLLQESEQSKIDILELNYILRQEASVDDLTKLKNRTALRNDFNQNIGRHVYIMMADVDHFKQYNDTYGHVIGDMVLQMVASATMESFKDGDAYRYGGDEFLILLPDYNEETFAERIGQWQKSIQSIQIQGLTHSITCSFGYECRLLKSTDDLRDAIKTADDRLYAAKNAQTMQDRR